MSRAELAETILARMGIAGVGDGVRDEDGWRPGSGPALTSTCPTSGHELARVGAASRDEYDVAVEGARDRFHEWRMRPAPVRGELVRALARELREHKQALGELVSLEMGKIRSEGLGEVQEMIDVCDFAVGLSRQLHGLTIASERPKHRMMEQWHPLGPIGIVTAFNFPVAVWAWNAAIAAVCGDPCVWKPSPRTPLCSIATQHLADRAMAACNAEGVWSLVCGGADPSRWMAEDPRLPLVSFTGSTAAGREVAAAVARRLGRSLLELGGNNAVIVAEDADLDLATRAIVFGAVGTAGQRCTSTRRVFAHARVHDELLERLRRAYATVKIGDPLAEGVLMGPLAAPSAVAAYLAALRAAQAQGGVLVCGGGVIEREGNFVEPAIVRAPPPDRFPIAREETFAPILYVFRVESVEEAIAAQNAVAHGLSSAIFTDSVRHAERFLSPGGSDCGIANVNLGTSGAEIGGAFGGEKDTGGGRESGSDAWKAYMRRQTATVNWGGELPLAQGVEFL